MDRGDELARLDRDGGDQLDAHNRDRRRELHRQFEQGPDPDEQPVEPLRLWEEGGVWCAILVAYAGALCGYARVPDGHPWVGLDGDDPAPGPDLDLGQPAEQAMDDHGVLPVFAAALGGDPDEFAQTLNARVAVHGGLTWTGPLPVAGAPHGWWLGFDCGHAGDAPDPARVPPELRAFAEALIGGDGHVWTEDEVALEVKRIVGAIAAAGGGCS